MFTTRGQSLIPKANLGQTKKRCVSLFQCTVFNTAEPLQKHQIKSFYSFYLCLFQTRSSRLLVLLTLLLHQLWAEFTLSRCVLNKKIEREGEEERTNEIICTSLLSLSPWKTYSVLALIYTSKQDVSKPWECYVTLQAVGDSSIFASGDIHPTFSTSLVSNNTVTARYCVLSCRVTVQSTACYTAACWL